jgi:mannitol-1-phosphate/altronate dehydrogenase
MIELRNENLRSIRSSIRLPDYDRKKIRPGIVHIGVGNFHRVHQATAIEECLHTAGNEQWAITGVGLTNGPSGRKKAASYRAQDNLYTVTELRSDLSMATQAIGAMVEYIHAPASPQAVLDRLAGPETHIVSLTITEGGYNIDETTGEFRLHQADVLNDLSGAPLRTAFGFIVFALQARWKAGLKPFTVVSCDNLRNNGNTSRRAIVAFARAVSTRLSDWIEENGAFPNSMVDRIAPQVSDEERERINAFSGINDLLPATCETYTKWVIEDDFCDGRPQLELGGVEFRNDVAAFEAVKGRLSNAAHMLMCYPSLLMGHRLVHEGMQESTIVRFLQTFWTLDTVPLVTPPEGYSIPGFTNQVVGRFSNPAIRDQLLRVAHDGAAKIMVFHGRTIRELIEKGKDLTREALMLACFSRYLLGADDLGKTFEVYEPQVADADWAIVRSNDPVALLRVAPFRSLELEQCAAFRDRYLDLRHRLASEGTTATLKAILV